MFKDLPGCINGLRVHEDGTNDGFKYIAEDFQIVFVKDVKVK